MSSKPKRISVLFNRFIEQQSTLFNTLDHISGECRSGIESTLNENERALLWKVLRSITKFESQFGQIESDFWTYWEGEGDTEYYSEIAAANGYETFIDYLLGELEKCNSWVDEIVTELSASGWEWEAVENLPDEFWRLIDSTEELIEASKTQLPHDELEKLLARIPPQRLAPIQIEVISSQFALKRINRSPVKVSLTAMRTAFGVVKSEVKDTLSELQNTNCDRRFLGMFERLVKALDREFSEIEPIEVGINLTIVEHSVRSVIEEVAETVFGRLAGNLVTVRQFIANFREWREYSVASLEIADLDRVLADAVDVESTLAHDAFAKEVQQQAHYYSTTSRQYESGAGKEIKSAFILSMQNIVSAVAREALKYIQLAASRAATVVGTAIGGVAVAWIALNLETLKTFARSQESFSWMIDIIEFIQKHLVSG